MRNSASVNIAQCSGFRFCVTACQSQSLAFSARSSQPFTDKQIELIETFADQAVIAIENVRLFNETKEALDQQKASADVLAVISSSIANARPVFDRILTSCERLFAGKLVGINLVGDDGMIRVGAYQGRGREQFEKVFPMPFSRHSGTARAILERRVQHYPDVMNGPDVPEGVTRGCAMTGVKACIFAPLLWEGRGLGAIFVGRDHVGEFSEKDIALLKTFADQAVIAIENTRLFEEVQARTTELTEALEQQTATSEVLKVISNSPDDLEPVFQTMLENAVRICEAGFGTMFRYDGMLFHRAAGVSAPPALVEFQSQRGPFVPEPGSRLLKLLQTGQVSHVADAAADAVPSISAKFGGARSVLHVPMLKDDELVGAIVIYRQEVRPFTDKQIELVKNFANQAVIAIENTRLLNELREIPPTADRHR